MTTAEFESSPAGQIWRGIMYKTQSWATGPLVGDADSITATLRDPELGLVTVYKSSLCRQLPGLCDRDGCPLFDGDVLTPLDDPEARWRAEFALQDELPTLVKISQKGFATRSRVALDPAGIYSMKGMQLTLEEFIRCFRLAPPTLDD